MSDPATTAERGLMLKLLGTFLSVEAPMPEMLRAHLAQPGKEAEAEALRAQIDAELADPQVSFADWTMATVYEFEDREEATAWLRSVRAYLYEGGPEPE